MLREKIMKWAINIDNHVQSVFPRDSWKKHSKIFLFFRMIVSILFLFWLYFFIGYFFAHENPNSLKVKPEFYWNYHVGADEAQQAIDIIETQGNQFLKMNFEKDFKHKQLLAYISYKIPQGLYHENNLIFSKDKIYRALMTNSAQDKLVEDLTPQKTKSYPAQHNISSGIFKFIDIELKLQGDGIKPGTKMQILDDSKLGLVAPTKDHRPIDHDAEWKVLIRIIADHGNLINTRILPDIHKVECEIDEQLFEQLNEMKMIDLIDQNFNLHFKDAEHYIGSQLTILAWATCVTKMLMCENYADLYVWLRPYEKNNKSRSFDLNYMPGVYNLPDYNRPENKVMMAKFNNFKTDMMQRHQRLLHDHHTYLMGVAIAVVITLLLYVFLAYLFYRTYSWPGLIVPFSPIIFITLLPFFIVLLLVIITCIFIADIPYYLHQLRYNYEEKKRRKIIKQQEFEKQQQEEQQRIKARLARSKEKEQKRREQQQKAMEKELIELEEHLQELLDWDYQSAVSDKRILSDNRQHIKEVWPQIEDLDLQFNFENLEKIREIISQYSNIYRLALEDLKKFKLSQQAYIKKIDLIFAQAEQKESYRLKLAGCRDDLKNLQEKIKNNDQRIKDLEILNHDLDVIIRKCNL